MRNLKTKYLWISVAVSFLIACGLIFAVTQTSGNLTNVVIVLIAIVFIYMTIAIQIASTKTFKYKPKKINYPIKKYTFNYEVLEQKLKKLGYKVRNFSYGVSYLKVSNTNAYKIVFIKDYKKYFNPEEETEKNQPSDKSLEKCKKFIGFELFLNYDEETLRKLVDFNLQGEKIYYSGLYVKDDLLICPNFIEPTNNFVDLYYDITNDLNLVEFEEETA